MSTRRPWLAWAAASLLALTNALVLTGVAYNRRPPPESVLTLSERELGPQWSWMWSSEENSGLTLQLQYRAESVWYSKREQAVEADAFADPFSGIAIPWLDRAKLAALGFDVNVPPGAADAATHYEHTRGRDVLLVIELDGPSRARALQRVKDLIAARERSQADSSDDREWHRLDYARKALWSEEHERSRLFVVDAGLEEAALRQRYPESTRYAIVRGHIRPTVVAEGGAAQIFGSVTALRCESINVPMRYRATLPVDRRDGFSASPDKKAPFTVKMAFGRRLEPWIESVVAGHDDPESASH